MVGNCVRYATAINQSVKRNLVRTHPLAYSWVADCEPAGPQGHPQGDGYAEMVCHHPYEELERYKDRRLSL